MSKATQKVKSIFTRINQTLKEAADVKNIEPVAQFTIDLIVKRARLGYGVDANDGDKFYFPSLSPGYIKQRERFAGLSETTSPKKSNITRTGQLLESVKIIKERNGEISIGPTGTRREGGLTNLKLAGFLAEKGRPFMHISRLEYNQILRFYRKTFGDLLDKNALLR